MDVFLLHCLAIFWASVLAARRLTTQGADWLLAAALLAWGNLVATSLLLSFVGRLGERPWFFATSLVLAGLGLLLMWRLSPEPPPPAGEPGANPWLRAAAALTLIPLALGLGAIAWTYAPNQTDALAVDLPRVMYYLGQNSLTPFDAADLRQTCLPFNHHLLLLFGAVYQPPLQCLNLFNLAAWALAGLALHRLCRLAGFGPNLALLTGGLLLVAPPVVALALSTGAALPAAAAVLAATVFGLRWIDSRRVRDAALAGLAAGLAAGSDLLVLVLSITTALAGLAIASRRFRRGGVILWLGSALLALALALPFVLLNLTGRAGGTGMNFRFLWENFTSAFLGPGLLTGFGLAGGMFVLCTLVCLFRHRLTPVPPLVRRIGSVALAVAAMAGAWSSGRLLLHHPARPLRPLLSTILAPPALPVLPLLLEHRLARQPRINVDTDGVDERIFPLLALGRNQRFTSHRKIDLDSYNLLSRAGSSRNAAWLDSAQAASYTLVPIPEKRTSGVEFLATLGTGAEPRDYFGLAAHPGRLASIDSNRNLLVTLYHENPGQGDPGPARLQVAGLNPEDKARVAVNLEYDDGSTEPLAAFSRDGEISLTLAHPFHRLGLKVLDALSGAEIGASAISYRPLPGAGAKPIDPAQPTASNSLFVTDLVLSKESPVSASAGLWPTEGPFPQWDIPFIRWAKLPSVILRIPAIPGLARAQLSFSVRLHVREKAGLDVLLNGALVRHFRIEGQTTWLDQSLDLDLRPGENVVEFRDAPLPDEPDWQDYLERYPDVKQYLEANRVPLEWGAREHFEKAGRREGRIVVRTNGPVPAHGSFYFMFRNIRLEGFKNP